MLRSDLATISESLYIQGVKATLWPELATGLTFFCTTHNFQAKSGLIVPRILSLLTFKYLWSLAPIRSLHQCVTKLLI